MLQSTILKSRCISRLAQLRFLAERSTDVKQHLEHRMEAWQIHSYKGLNDLRLSNVRIPVILHPTDVLVKVEAASVNPIDIAMTNGYGETLLNLIRKTKSITYDELELPLTLGRDFSGTIVSKGCAVGDRLELDEEVWGVIPLEQQGCHANYVVVDSSLVYPRPQRLSYIEAASILYAGLTAWSALWYTGGLCYKTAIITRMNRSVLVMGGSGGVGTLAIQLLKAWNMKVIATCSSDAVNTLQDLGADEVIDYKQNDADAQIISKGPYDIILDCAKQGPEYVKMKGYPHNNYITLNSPMVKNLDQHGIIMGTAKNVCDLLKFNIPKAKNSNFVKWGFFLPSATGIEVLQKFVENGNIVPVVQQVYPFQDLPLAYERMGQGHLRGKLIIDMK